MKRYFDCGIDLGTTNSCIAIPNGDNTCTIIDNTADGMQVTPSAVWVRNGRVVTGQRAYTTSDVTRERREFKRDMGSDVTYEFPGSEHTYTPVELSAEILKSLRNDAALRTGKPMDYAVITVPAAFSMVQCEATMRAAELAGFKRSILLQEPIAAAVCYGAQPDARDQCWVVFDYGGGTLDVSIVSAVDGRLETIANRGDNRLGGKDLDRALLDQVILPRLSERYDVAGGLSPENRMRALLDVERCKIELTTTESTVFDPLDVQDNSGKLICEPLTITRDDFEQAIYPEVRKAVSLMRQTIDDAGIQDAQIAKVALVGGSTFVPLVRRLVAETVDAPLDTTINPMTVVAQGAALYAAMQEVPEDALPSAPEEADPAGKQTDGGLPVPATVSARIEYPRMTSAESEEVLGRIFPAQGVSEIRVECVADDEVAWSSGWRPLDDPASGVFYLEVAICATDSANNYKVRARNSGKEEIALEDSEFSIRHAGTVLKPLAPPLPHSIGILVSDGLDNRIDWIIKKDTKLPVSHTVTYRLNKLLSPFSEDECQILVYEGDNTWNPDANTLMRTIHVTSRDTDVTLLEGTEVEITIDIDENRCVTLTGNVPEYDLQLVAESLGSSEENYLDYRQALQQVREKMGEVQFTIDALKRRGTGIDDLEQRFIGLSRGINRISDLIDTDNDAVDDYIREFYAVQTSLIQAERLAREKSAGTGSAPAMESLMMTVMRFGTESQQHSANAIYDKYQQATGLERTALVNRMNDLANLVLNSSFQLLGAIYRQSYKLSTAFTDDALAARYKEDAESAISRRDAAALRAAISNLSGLSLKTSAQTVDGTQADLRVLSAASDTKETTSDPEEGSDNSTGKEAPMPFGFAPSKK